MQLYRLVRERIRFPPSLCSQPLCVYGIHFEHTHTDSLSLARSVSLTTVRTTHTQLVHTAPVKSPVKDHMQLIICPSMLICSMGPNTGHKDRTENVTGLSGSTEGTTPFLSLTWLFSTLSHNQYPPGDLSVSSSIEKTQLRAMLPSFCATYSKYTHFIEFIGRLQTMNATIHIIKTHWYVCIYSATQP